MNAKVNKLSEISVETLTVFGRLGEPEYLPKVADVVGEKFDRAKAAKAISNLAIRGYLKKKQTADGYLYSLTAKGKTFVNSLGTVEIFEVSEDESEADAGAKNKKRGRPKGTTGIKKTKAEPVLQGELVIPEYNVSAIADQLSELVTAVLVQNNRYRQIAVQVIKYASTNLGKDDAMILRQSLVNIIQLASTILTEEEKQTLL